MTSLEPLMRRNFLEYASYVVVDRAIPDIRDGLKPVQRRILHTLHTLDDGRLNKLANVIGDCMKYHPHGDASIGDALVVLANKEYFIERQGNFGNVITGDGAAAARYIECRLTPLARETMFNPALTRYLPSYDGKRMEPEVLPAKLPVVLLLGTEGIAVGMATTILSHNFVELLEAQISILQGRPFKLYPDFIQGGLMDVAEYDHGRGKVRLRARIEADGDKRVVIREIPFGTTTTALTASISAAVEKGKVKITDISDRTGHEVEIELRLARGAYAAEVIPQLYAYTDCEVSISSNIVVIRDQRPAELTVEEILVFCTDQLREQIKAELEHEIAGLLDKQHSLTLEQIFIENRIYKRIEEAATEEAVDEAVRSGMAPFAHLFVRELVADDVARLLDIRIKRISRYDLDKNRRDIDDIVKAMKSCRARLRNLVPTTIAWIESMLAKHGKAHPRRTEITTFAAVDKKAVANANLRLGYDASNGFFGSAVKASDRELRCSEYDRILAVMADGSYRIMAPLDKTVLEGKLLHLAVFDQEQGVTFTVVYRDSKRIPWAKRVHIQSFIKDKEYELIKDKAGTISHLSTEPGGIAVCHMVPAPRQRVREERFELSSLELSGVSSRGTRIADRPTAKIVIERA